MNKKHLKEKEFYFWIGIGAVLLTWIILSLTLNNSVAIPSIWDTVKELGNILSKGRSYAILGATLLRLIIAIGISFILGLTLSFLSYKYNRVKWFLKPIVSVIRSIPVVAIIVIILMLTKVKYASMVICGFVAFPIIYTTLLEGMDSIESDLLDDVKTLSDIDFKMVIKLLIPLMSQYLLIALVSATGLGLKVLVMSEFIAAPKYSIAREMSNYQSAFEMSGIFAWVIIMLAFILLFEYLIKSIESKE